MAAPVLISGFEDFPTGAIGNNARWYVDGSPTIDGSTVTGHGNSLKIVNAGAQQDVGLSSTASISSATWVVRLGLWIGSVSTDAQIFEFYASDPTNCFLGYDSATGRLCVYGSSWAGRALGPAVSTGQLYIIDLKVDASTTTIDWAVDGSAQSQFSIGGSTGTYDAIFIGHRSTSRLAYGTCTFYVPWVVISTTAGDYPLDVTRVVGYRVGNTSGTHNQTAGDLKEHGGSNLTDGDGTGADLNETTAPDTTSYIYQGVSRATSYAEYIYASSGADAAPIGVEQTVAVIGAGAGTNKQKAQLYDGTSAADAYAYATTAATLTFHRKCWAAPPSGGAWTLAKLQACRLRWGFSDDVDPVPRLTWTIIEAALPDASGVTGTGAFTAGLPTIAGTGGVPYTTPTWHVRANWDGKPSFEDAMVALSPKLYLRCGESAGTRVHDRVNGMHGTLNGTATWGTTGLLTEDSATALTLDGASGYITIPDHADLDQGDTFWFAALVKRAGTGAAILADKGTNGFSIGFDADDKPYLAKTGTATICTGTTAVDDTDAHLLIVRKVTTSTVILLDGEDISGAVSDQTIANTATDLHIGRAAAGGSFLAATIQEVGFGSTLTDAQAAALGVAFLQGEFGGANDDITSRVMQMRWNRGRTVDFSGEQSGTLTLVCRNNDSFFAGAKLLPGSWVHVYGTSAGTDHAKWFGRITRVVPEPHQKRVTLTVSEPLARKNLVDLPTRHGQTHREWRADIIERAAASLAGGYRNVCTNGGFETDTAGWTQVTGTIARSTAAAKTGAASLLVTGDGAAVGKARWADTRQTFRKDKVFRASVWLRTYGSPSTITLRLGQTQTYGWVTVHSRWTVIDPKTGKGTEQDIPWQYRTVNSGTGATVVLGSGGVDLPSSSDFEEVILTFVNPSETTGLQLDVTTGSTSASNGVYVDDVIISEGLDAHDYVAYSAPVGRQPNACPNPSFEVDRLGWEPTFVNACTNPEATTDTSGWSDATDSFVTSADATISRVADYVSGVPTWPTTHAFKITLGSAAVGQGAFFPVTGTFRAGHRYRVFGTVMRTGGPGVKFGIGSDGTPADYAETATISTDGVLTWALTWTPTGDRTDAHFYAVTPGGAGFLHFTAVCIVPYARTVPTTYVKAGITGLSEYDTLTRNTSDSTDGNACGQLGTCASAGSGMQCALTANGVVVGYSGVPVTTVLDVWTDSGTAALTLGMGSPASVTDTATLPVTATTTKTRVAWTWTPTGDRTDAILYVVAGAASAVTVDVDAIRTTIGKAVDLAYLPAQCDGLDPDEDGIVPKAALSQVNAAAAIADISTQTMGRHWFEATMHRPWWRVSSRAIGGYAALASSQTWSDVQVAALDIDEASVINTIECTYAEAGYVPDVGYSAAYTSSRVIQAIDADSREAYGPAPKVVGGWAVNVPIDSLPSGATLDTEAQDIADFAVAGHADPKARPRVTLHNKSSASIMAQMTRRLDDKVELDVDAFTPSATGYLIASEEVSVEMGRTLVRATYQLEEAP